MAVEKDGLALALEPVEHIADFRTTDGIDPVGGFIQHQHVRFVQHRLGQAEPLQHALGVLGDIGAAPVGQADRFQQVPSSTPCFGHRETAEAAVVFQCRISRQVPWDPVTLGQVTDPSSTRLVAGRLSQQHGFTGGLVDDSQQHLDERGLARAVGSEQSEDLAGPHFQRHTLEGLDFSLAEQPVTIGLAEVGDLDDEVGRSGVR